MTRGRIGGALLVLLGSAVGLAAPAWAGDTERVSLGPRGAQADDHSIAAALSADGRFVAFGSYAGNLVSGDTNGEGDIFVRDRTAGRTTRVSVGARGVQADGGGYELSISADGHLVAFRSDATNLVPGDTNGASDVFVRDRRTGTTERVSVGPGGRQADGYSSSPALSADGRFVAFYSEAGNLVPGDTNGAGDIFVHDRRTGRTGRASLGPRGRQADADSGDPVLSADGRFVAFYTEASNLVPGDTNGELDVFVRALRAGTTKRVSLGARGAQGNNDSYAPSLSADGRLVAFGSSATNLVPGDTNRVDDIFVRVR